MIFVFDKKINFYILKMITPLAKLEDLLARSICNISQSVSISDI